MPSFAVPGAVLDHDLAGPAGAPGGVVLHGLTSSRAREARLGLDVAERAVDAGLALRLLRYDARGHGRSTGRDRPTDYGWAALAGDLLALLDAVHPGEPVHGTGPSMGAGTLLHAAVRRPDRFASLCLVLPPTAWATRPAQARTYRDQADLVARHGVDALVAAGALVPAPPAAAAVPATRPDVDPTLLPAVLRGAAGADLPPPAALAALTVPTLLLAWTDDPAHPLETAEALHAHLPASRLVVAATPADREKWPALLADQVAACRS